MSNYSTPFLLSTLLMLTTTQSLAAPECKAIFSKEANASSEIQRQIESLAAYRLQLDTARAEGKTSTAISAKESDYIARETDLLEHIKKNNLMTTAELREKFKEVLTRIQNVSRGEKEIEQAKKEKQKRVLKDTVIDGSRAIFHRIEPGTFAMTLVESRPNNPSRGTVSVTLTKSFEMMATPVTQLIWRIVAELANSKLNQAPLDLDPSTHKGALHPVETASPMDIQLWLESLNRLSAAGDPMLPDLIAGHKTGDKYRLPTEAEWEFVVTQRGENKINVLDPSWLESHAWYFGNGGETTHIVAQKKPLIVDSKNFFDLIGNTSELTADSVKDDETPIRGGIDPHYFNGNNALIHKGGTFFTQVQRLQNSIAHSTVFRDQSFDYLSFRLIREPRDSGGTP